MEEFRGIIIYNIELDGNLNGVYTNNHPEMRGRIFTETARIRINSQPYNGEDGIFVYDSAYIDIDNSFVNCELVFTVQNRVISATWNILERGIIFRGEGFLMNDRQIAISYWFNS